MPYYDVIEHDLTYSFVDLEKIDANATLKVRLNCSRISGFTIDPGEGGGHSTKNVHGSFEQRFSDPTLNKWLRILTSAPKHRNWEKF